MSEVPAPAQIATPPSPTAESRTTPEALRELRMHEIRTVATASIIQSARSVEIKSQAEMAALPEQTRNTAYALNTLKTLLSIDSPAINPPFYLVSQAKGNIESGNDPYVIYDETSKKFVSCDALRTPNGSEIRVKIVAVTGSQEGNFRCIVQKTTAQGGKPDFEEMFIPKSDVLDSQILAEENHIVAEFPEDDPRRMVVKTHIEALKKPGEVIAADDVPLAEAAKATGVLTVDDLNVCAIKQGVLIEIPAGTSDEEKQKANIENARRKEAAEKMMQVVEHEKANGATLASIETTARFFRAAGLEQNQIQIRLQQSDTALKTIQDHIRDLSEAGQPVPPRILKQLDEAKGMFEMYKEASEGPDFQESIMGGVVQDLASGEISNKDAIQLVDTIKNNNTEAVCNYVIGELDKEGQKLGEGNIKARENIERKKARINKLKTAGGLLAALMSMYVWQGFKKSRQDGMAGQAGMQ